MGLQHHHRQSRLAVDFSTHRNFPLSTSNTLSLQVCREGVGKKCHRKGTLDKAPEQVIHGPQEQLSGQTSHPRPIAPEQINQVQQIQNVNSRPSSSDASSKRMDMFSRPSGCILARSYRPPLPTIPGVSSRTRQISFKGRPLRAEHSTKGVHEISLCTV